MQDPVTKYWKALKTTYDGDIEEFKEKYTKIKDPELSLINNKYKPDYEAIIKNAGYFQIATIPKDESVYDIIDKFKCKKYSLLAVDGAVTTQVDKKPLKGNIKIIYARKE